VLRGKDEQGSLLLFCWLLTHSVVAAGLEALAALASNTVEKGG